MWRIQRNGDRVGRTARRAWLLSAVCCATASAQLFVDDSHLAAVRHAFDRASEHSLSCEFRALPPALGYNLRFYSGYQLHFALKQFSGAGRGVVVLLRVTPESSEPRYLVSSYDLPAGMNPKADGEVYGGFHMGEGRYTVSALMLDETHRACRADWRIEAKLQSSERHLHLAMEPGSITDLRWQTRPAAVADGHGLGRLTVLLHAAPLKTGRSKLSSEDMLDQVGALSGLLEQLPAASVRVAVFNLDQQKVVLREDHAGAEVVDRVARALNELQLGTVPLKVLQNSAGAFQLLAGLINAPLREDGEADTVVLLGPDQPLRDRVPEGVLLARSERKARLFYLEFQARRPSPSESGVAPFGGGRRGRTQPTPPGNSNAAEGGIIEHAVGQLKGQTILVSRPAEFADAIKKLLPRER